MLALVKYGPGKGETALQDIPVPSVGDDDLLIEVKAAGICGSDLAYDHGEHPEHLNCPVVLGHEFAGIVSQVGKNVKGWSIGDRIVSDNTGYVCGTCQACATGQFLQCEHRLGLGYGMDGGFTDYVRISGDLLRKNPNSLFCIPNSVSFQEAAILDPICNAYMAVVQESSVLPGEDIVVFGTGPIGLFSIQIAHLMGCAHIIVIGRSTSEEKLKIARKFGATDVILSDQQDIVLEIDRITKGKKVAVAIDAAGPNSVLRQAISIVKKGGEIIKIGYDSQPCPFSLDELINKGISLKGHFGYNFESWNNVLRLLEIGKLDTASVITHYIPLEDWQIGFDLIRRRQAIKIIITKDERLLKSSRING
jgi:threonine dehydrogenase-like Zn-dependent dehydrogenase